MKRQFALLFALTFMVSGLAGMAEEAAQTEIVENDAVQSETVETEWTAPFEDGDWLSIPEWNAEVYLPTGWMLSEVTETGFIATDAEGASSMTVAVEEFAVAETEAGAESEETAQQSEEVIEEAQSVELSAFEEYLLGLGQEYELVLMGDRQAAIFTGEESVDVRFVMDERLVTMTFAPATEGGIADSALSIAETFYIYTDVETGTVETEETAETIETEAAAEETVDTEADAE